MQCLRIFPAKFFLSENQIKFVFQAIVVKDKYVYVRAGNRSLYDYSVYLMRERKNIISSSMFVLCVCVRVSVFF